MVPPSPTLSHLLPTSLTFSHLLPPNLPWSHLVPPCPNISQHLSLSLTSSTIIAPPDLPPSRRPRAFPRSCPPSSPLTTPFPPPSHPHPQGRRHGLGPLPYSAHPQSRRPDRPRAQRLALPHTDPVAHTTLPRVALLCHPPRRHHTGKRNGTPTTSPHTSTHHCTRAEDDSALLRPSTPFCALLRPSAPFSPFRAAPPYRCLPNPFFASPLLFPTAPLNLLPVPVYSSCGPHRWRRRCGGLVTKAASSSPSTPAYRARILSTSPHRHATRLHFAPSSCMPAHAPSRRVHAIARHGHTLSNRN